ncbi:MAG: ABC transporter substrate-binding protein [Candidatus Geothermarchaeales archaeon]
MRAVRFGLSLLVGIAMLASVLAVIPSAQVASAQAEPFILRVGVQDETKTRNLIAVDFMVTDVWTADVLGPTIEGTIQTNPETQELVPYVMVGTDLDGDGNFTDNEFGVFANISGKPEDYVAFYDVCGMRFHDGTPVQMVDVLFGYHAEGLSPAVVGARFTMDQAGQPGTNFTVTHWQWINPVSIPTGGWLGSNPQTRTGDQLACQFALKFKMTAPFAQFILSTMQTSIHPAYFWQGTGLRKENGEVVERDIHPDFGWAVNPDTMNGVPAAGATLEAGFAEWELQLDDTLTPFSVKDAGEWDATDNDVIGSGPFKFVTWEPGVIARVERNPDYYVPDYPTLLEAGLRVPALEGIIYKIFRTTQAAVFALQAGEIDYVAWSIPPEFVPPLLADPNIGIKSNAEQGFFYLAYNMRLLPFGYDDPELGSDDPANDVGKPFRRAVAHVIDKRTVVTTLLQNFGVVGLGPVSPSNVLYYNTSLPRYEFNLDIARGILDAVPGWDDPDGPCQVDGSGCRSFDRIGNRVIEILTPQADYDPIRAAAGALIAQNMREIGINAVSKPTAFGEIVDLVDLLDFEMFILGWRIGGAGPPDHIEAFFHSRHRDPFDFNSPGYKNSTFDAIVDQALGETDPEEEVRLWKWSQGIISTDLPYDVLYYRTNIEAFRSDKLDPDSWSVNPGGFIFTFWSWIKLDPAPAGALRLSITAPSAVSSGTDASVVVTVRDPEGNRVVGADVTLTITGPGTLSATSGTTDGNGQLTVTFTAPTLAATDDKVNTFIEAKATHPDFGTGPPATALITTFPPGVKFLSLTVDFPFGNVVSEGTTTVLDVSVRDETGLPAEGASVVLSVSPVATLTPDSFTTGATGTQSVTFEAPEVDADQAHTMTIVADKTGYAQGSVEVTLTVLNVPPPAAPPIPLEIPLIIGGAVGAGAAAGIYGWYRRKRG